MTDLEQDKLFETAIDRCKAYLVEAKNFGEKDANCAFVATVGANKQPSVRIITIYDISEQGLLFLANNQSGKINQIRENPKVGLSFYWPSISMQVGIEGIVEELDRQQSATLWAKRDHNAKLSAWASDIAKEHGDSASFEKYKAAARERFAGAPPLADSWSGYCIKPNRLVFWHTQWKKNKPQECYLKKGGFWHLELQ